MGVAATAAGASPRRCRRSPGSRTTRRAPAIEARGKRFRLPTCGSRRFPDCRRLPVAVAISVAYNGLTWWIGHRLGRAPRFRANRDEFGIAAHNAGDRSTVDRWLALRPEFSTQARMPPTAFLAPRGVRRGLPVLTAGLVPDSYRRYPTGPVASSLSNARGPWPSSFRASQWRDWKA